MEPRRYISLAFWAKERAELAKAIAEEAEAAALRHGQPAQDAWGSVSESQDDTKLPRVA